MHPQNSKLENSREKQVRANGERREGARNLKLLPRTQQSQQVKSPAFIINSLIQCFIGCLPSQDSTSTGAPIESSSSAQPLEPAAMSNPNPSDSIDSAPQNLQNGSKKKGSSKKSKLPSTKNNGLFHFICPTLFRFIHSPDNPSDPRRRKKKTMNLNTYKVHALGDYVDTIRRLGTSDSYSTELVCFQPFKPIRCSHIFLG